MLIHPLPLPHSLPSLPPFHASAAAIHSALLIPIPAPLPLLFPTHVIFPLLSVLLPPRHPLNVSLPHPSLCYSLTLPFLPIPPSPSFLSAPPPFATSLSFLLTSSHFAFLFTLITISSASFVFEFRDPRFLNFSFLSLSLSLISYFSLLFASSSLSYLPNSSHVWAHQFLLPTFLHSSLPSLPSPCFFFFAPLHSFPPFQKPVVLMM